MTDRTTLDSGRPDGAMVVYVEAELCQNDHETNAHGDNSAEVFEAAARLGWDDGRLSFRLGVDPRTVRAWRRGEREPSLTHLYLMRMYVLTARTCPGAAVHVPDRTEFYVAVQSVIGRPLRLATEPGPRELESAVRDGTDGRPMAQLMARVRKGWGQSGELRIGRFGELAVAEDE